MNTYEEIEKKYEDWYDDYLDWLVATIKSWTNEGEFSDYSIIVSDEELKEYCRNSEEWFFSTILEADEAQEEYDRYIAIEKKIDDEEEISDEEKTYYDSYDGYDGEYFNYDYICNKKEPLEKFRDMIFTDSEGLKNWFYQDITDDNSTIARKKTEEEIEAVEEENKKFHQYD